MPLPRALSAAIEEEVRRFDRRALIRAAEDLSQAYRSGSQPAKSLLRSDVHRAAYLVTRVPATYAAVRAVLEETKLRLHETNIRSLLDLGAGPGTAAWAAADVFPQIERFTLLERDSDFIRTGSALAKHSPQAALVNACWQQADLNSVAEFPQHDLVVLSYSLGEVGASESLLRKAWVAAQVALAIIEPGTPRGFQTILDARSQLVGSGAHVAAPCPHDRECPMAGSNKDWCHFAARLERSALHRRAKTASMGYEDEKFSYVVGSKSEVTRAAARVTRHPLTHKGHIQLEICTSAGLKKQVVSRSEGDAFRRARKAEWGSAWE
jgi:ribosomal protein RSM22 (predicted rRNA methylase)